MKFQHTIWSSSKTIIDLNNYIKELKRPITGDELCSLVYELIMILAEDEKETIKLKYGR